MSTTYPGGFITKNAPTVSQSGAQGIWTMDQAMQYRKSNLWPWAPVQSVITYSVDLDGTNDYFSRASDFTGNADGKTFTFSAWVWLGANYNGEPFYVSDTGAAIRFQVYYNGANGFTVIGRDSSNTTILTGNIASSTTAITNTWTHILISCDLTNTSNRYAYINDVDGVMSFSPYTNANINFSNANHRIGASFSGAVGDMRISNVFLDYTYRDLSNVTNRRLFITADRKPAAGQAALNPIMYLPMDDPTTAHINLGTGGNMTLNGTIARSGRGPNQFNVPYSDLDGANDRISRTTNLTGISDSKTITFACSFNLDSVGGEHCISLYDGADQKFRVRVDTFTLGGGLLIRGFDSTNTAVLYASIETAYFVTGRNYHLVFSCDLSDTGKRHLYIDGQSVSPIWNTYVNAAIDLTASTPKWDVGGSNATADFDGRLGNVFFHTSYIDLSVASNLAKFVTGTGIDAKPVDMGADGSTPLGVQPLIYLPMYGNNAGKNYGSGGDFTVNSGPYTGARGPNEYWGNKADFDGSTGYLARTSALTGVSDGKTFSFSFFVNVDAFSTEYILSLGTSNRLGIHLTSSYVDVIARNSSGSTILEAYNSLAMSAGTTYHICGSFDLTDSAKSRLYVNNANQSLTQTPFTNDNINLSVSNTYVGIRGDLSAGTALDGKLSEFYFTTDYIDFSQEANRLKFRDCFGNPCDLGADGSTPTGTAPAIYMRFDPAAQGTNSGTGGAFTKSGTIADGGQL